MSDFMQEYEYYKTAWEKAVSERTKLRDERIAVLEAEIEILEKQNAKYREALMWIADGNVAPSSIKQTYIDEAYQEIAREALKGE